MEGIRPEKSPRIRLSKIKSFGLLIADKDLFSQPKYFGKKRWVIAVTID